MFIYDNIALLILAYIVNWQRGNFSIEFRNWRILVDYSWKFYSLPYILLKNPRCHIFSTGSGIKYAQE